MCTALRSTSFSSLLYCDHKITKWACVLVHVCELVLILRNSPVPKSVSVFSLGKMLYLRCFLVHALMEFLGNVCHKECNIFQYPRRDSTEFSCCLHWYVVCRNVNFFFFLLLSSLLIILLRGLGSSHLISTSYGKMEEENTLQSALFVLLKTGLLKSWAPGESCD